MDANDEDFEDAYRDDVDISSSLPQRNNRALKNHNNRKGDSSLSLIKTTKNHFRRFLEYIRGLDDEEKIPFNSSSYS